MAYIESNKIWVYPCAYRKYTSPTATDNIDIKSRLNTEENFVEGVSYCGKNYYYEFSVGSVNYTVLFIHGYKFTIMSTLLDLKNNKGQYACIKLNTSDTNVGKVLAKADGTVGTLDEGGLFKGLAFDSTCSSYTDHLDLDDASNAFPIDTASIAASEKGKTITNNLVNGTASGSIVQVSSSTTSLGNSAVNINSIALGVGNITSKENQVLVGKYSNPDDNTLFAVGNGTSDTPHNIIKLEQNNIVIPKKLATASYNDTVFNNSGEGIVDTIRVKSFGPRDFNSTSSGDLSTILLRNAECPSGLVPCTIRPWNEYGDWTFGTEVYKITNIYTKNLCSDTSSMTSMSGKDLALTNSLVIKNGPSMAAKLNISNSGALNTVSDITMTGATSGQTLTIGNTSTNYGVVNIKGSASITLDSHSSTAVISVATNKFKVDSSGNVTAVSYNATSDIRKKENIVDYTPEKSILDLQVKKFDFIDGPKNQIGCTAQDLREICPEIVNEDADGYLSIQESKLVYLLLDEVKKLKEEIKELKK